MLATTIVLAVICCVVFVAWFVKNRDKKAGRAVIKTVEKVTETIETMARKAGM